MNEFIRSFVSRKPSGGGLTEVDSRDALPGTGSDGDTYIVGGTALYQWQGGAWRNISVPPQLSSILSATHTPPEARPESQPSTPGAEAGATYLTPQTQTGSVTHTPEPDPVHNTYLEAT